MSADDATTATTESATILVVEDEVMLRVVAAEVLADAGFTVKEAADGGAAFRMLQSGEVKADLVISDVRMPVMNGYELAAAVMNLHPAPKLLLMTGYTQEPLPPALLKAGIRVIYKPFDFDSLPKLAREIMRAV
jgi:CheY-like chemotaxis protein